MARHSGKNGIVKNGGTVIDGMTNFEVDETVGETDLTAAGDSWKTHDTNIPEWSLSITLKLDHAVAAGQALRAGQVIAFEGYTEGDAAGRTYYSGNATILGHKVGSPFEGEVTREFTCKGQGPLAVAEVA